MRVGSRKLTTVVWRAFIVRHQRLVKSLTLIRNNRTSTRDVRVCDFPRYSFCRFRGRTRHLLNFDVVLSMLTPQLLARYDWVLSRMLGYLGEIWKPRAIVPVNRPSKVFIPLFQKCYRVVFRRVPAILALAVRRSYFPQKVEAKGKIWKCAGCHWDIIICHIHGDWIFFEVLIVNLVVWLWLRAPKDEIQTKWLQIESNNNYPYCKSATNEYMQTLWPGARFSKSGKLFGTVKP